MPKEVVQDTVVTFLIDRSGQMKISGNLDFSRLGFERAAKDQPLFSMTEKVPGVIALVKRAFDGGTVSQEIIADGHVYSNSYSSLADENGNVMRIMGVSIDITESRRTE